MNDLFIERDFLFSFIKAKFQHASASNLFHIKVTDRCTKLLENQHRFCFFWENVIFLKNVY